ncbi:hypothetical protein G7066_13300 [Leucobacter coleopterorum]|uniref:Polysaccharide pyruvyl transferase domain-containing protein n=1 Tax=Leucobacter coleopterorum TaxID=2714933 RepID=A0ABX6JYD3_9MICO|nr:polysaccharide pyruvyl transferase family protein [Leucobacter coleopterorum]QIM19301.1 hypothetical protein G7066_13300 [Leucobacter coleopterorum]
MSWQRDYHLGDEAMTEVAITQLQRRGAEVTLIAGDPALSRDFYHVDTVPQFGFRTLPNRKKMEARFAEIVAALNDDTAIPDYAVETLRSVETADAVLIAGGGNLNSSWAHHIFERLTLKRIAEARGIPLYITSQTVGPELNDLDRKLMREMAGYARVFGAREATTTALMREVAGSEASVVHTLDDAVLLEPSALSPETLADLALPERYLVASFTFHSWSTALSQQDYYRRIAAILDDIVAQGDVNVLLLPHMGSLDPNTPRTPKNDVTGHEHIERYSQSGRVRSVPMMSARDLLAVTQGAQFTVSTRYHPVVFGAAVGVPAVGIVTSYYSAIRMRGALSNVGMEQFAIPFEAWQPLFGSRLMEAIGARLDTFRAHSVAAGAQMREYQARWWDGIVSDIAGSGAPLLEDHPPAEILTWADERTTELLALARVAQEGTNLQRLEARADKAAREEQLQQLRGEFRAELAEIRHRLRPPGAALRDRIRTKLQRRR